LAGCIATIKLHLRRTLVRFIPYSTFLNQNIKNIKMKTLHILLSFCLTSLFTIASFAQDKTETYAVAGNCGMCQKKIESAAKKAGAVYASWNKDTKQLTVKYNSTSTNEAKIQQEVADAGYDTPNFKATDEAYNKLEKCCQYDRATATTGKAAMQCSDKCDMKDGKCTDMAKCKEMGCCKDEAACKDKGCCKKDGTGATMNCADMKTSMTNAKAGKSCCKKS
jgi:periplasmic mercuric ion binding protein